MKTEAFNQLAGRLNRCDREISQAIEESRKSHTKAEHIGILLWEMDWRAEREAILLEFATQITDFGAASETGGSPTFCLTTRNTIDRQGARTLCARSELYHF
jgi:hypothetical protein